MVSDDEGPGHLLGDADIGRARHQLQEGGYVVALVIVVARWVVEDAPLVAADLEGALGDEVACRAVRPPHAAVPKDCELVRASPHVRRPVRRRAHLLRRRWARRLCSTDTDTRIGIEKIRIRGYNNFLKNPIRGYVLLFFK